MSVCVSVDGRAVTLCVWVAGLLAGCVPACERRQLTCEVFVPGLEDCLPHVTRFNDPNLRCALLSQGHFCVSLGPAHGRHGGNWGTSNWAVWSPKLPTVLLVSRSPSSALLPFFG